MPLERPDGVLLPLVLFAFGVTAAVGRSMTGAWADRAGAHGLLAGAIATAALGVCVLAGGLALPESSGALTVAVAGASLSGAGYGAVQILTMLVAFERADDMNRASAVWNAAFDSGLAAGAAAVTAVAVGLGLPLAYLAGGLLMLMSLPLVGHHPARGSATRRASGLRPLGQGPRHELARRDRVTTSCHRLHM